MDNMSYRCPEPYPVPENLKKNTYFARVLLSMYSGQVSEMTAVAQYIYHHMEADGVNQHISDGLRGIAVTEMRHLDMLGECIHKLGIQPRFRYFRGNRSMYWHAGFVSYGNSLDKMIQADLQGEYDAIEHYKSAIKAIREPQIQRLLNRIIEDEMLHIELLQSYLLLLQGVQGG